MHEGHTRRPRRVVARTLGLGIGALAMAAALTWAPAAASGWSQSSAESTLWQLLNGARTNNGRAPLQQHSTLVSLARWRSSDMLAKSYFSHTIVGCGCLVYAYYDSNGLAYDWAGENIGWNAGHPDCVLPGAGHEQFMASAGHRANVLDPSFTHGGVGAAAADNAQFLGHMQSTRMYTELFMEATSGAPAPPPAQPAPPAQPPPPAGGGSGGSGGGAAAPTQPSPTPRAPSSQRATMDAPRPTDLDGGDRWRGHGRVAADHDGGDRAVARGRDGDGSDGADRPPRCRWRGRDRRSPRLRAEPGLFDGIIGSILGFLFG